MTKIEIRTTKFPNGSLAELVVSDPESADHKTIFEIENPNQSGFEWLVEVKDKLFQHKAYEASLQLLVNVY